MGNVAFFAGLLLPAFIFGSNASGQTTATGPGALAQLKGGELIAEVADRAAWCKRDITFTIRSQDAKYFDHTERDVQGRLGQITLQRLLGTIRVALEKSCPQAHSVTFNGFVDDVFIYRGYAEKNSAGGEWVLIELPVSLVKAPEPPPPPPKIAAAQVAPFPDPASVGECDRLAAHPDDSQKPKNIKGVSDDDLKPGPALSACEKALTIEPDNSRVKFQLARALIAYNKPADGVEMLTEAAEQGSGAATAALGDITLYGLIDGNPDPEMAKKLYLQAENLGFKPAKALAAAIEANPNEDTAPQIAAEPQYHMPNRVKWMLEGKALPGQGGDFVDVLAYGSRFIAGIIHQCPDRGVSLTPQQILNTVHKRAGVAIGFLGMSALGEGAYSGTQQKGMDDGYALAMTAGCKSLQVQAAEETMRKTFQ